MERMISSKTVLLFFLPLFLLACSTPIPKTYAPSMQHKMQSAHHWDVLAEDVVDVIAETVLNNPGIEKTSFVVKSADQTKFSKGFKDLLMTRMVARGFDVQKEFTRDTLVVENNIEVLRHLSVRDTISVTGVPQVLSSQVQVFRGGEFFLAGSDLVTAAESPGGEKITIAADGVRQSTEEIGLRRVKFSGGLPHTEVIITSALVDGNRYLARYSNIYYINDPDFWHYETLPVAETAEDISIVEVSKVMPVDETPELRVRDDFN